MSDLVQISDSRWIVADPQPRTAVRMTVTVDMSSIAAAAAAAEEIKKIAADGDGKIVKIKIIKKF